MAVPVTIDKPTIGTRDAGNGGESTESTEPSRRRDTAKPIVLQSKKRTKTNNCRPAVTFLGNGQGVCSVPGRDTIGAADLRARPGNDDREAAEQAASFLIGDEWKLTEEGAASTMTLSDVQKSVHRA
jgi:hypothetical protein